MVRNKKLRRKTRQEKARAERTLIGIEVLETWNKLRKHVLVSNTLMDLPVASMKSTLAI